MSPPARRPPPLEAPSGAPPRLSPRELPGYRYVPRSTPHPVTHPDGHSYGVRDVPIELGARRLPDDWRDVDEYLHGIDLYNAAFFWEAHESWEAVWHAVPRDSEVGRFLQALIQAAAALLQHHCGHARGSANLLRRAGANLEAARRQLATEGGERFMGVEIGRWWPRLEAYVSADGSEFPFLEVR